MDDDELETADRVRCCARCGERPAQLVQVLILVDGAYVAALACPDHVRQVYEPHLAAAIAAVQAPTAAGGPGADPAG